MSTSYRLDIKGQISLSNPWAGLCETIEVTRDSVPAIEEPSNYQTFCNDVDEALQKLVPAKILLKLCSILATLFIITALLPQIFSQVTYMGSDRMFIFFWVAAVIGGILAVIYCKICASLRGVFYNDIKQICERYSIPDGINYLVKDERWDGCSKAYDRKYYLIVTVPVGYGDDSGGYDAEQQQPIGSNGGGTMITAQTGVPVQPPIQATIVDDSFKPNPPETAPNASTTTNNNNGGTTSLFDQLSGQLSGGAKY